MNRLPGEIILKIALYAGSLWPFVLAGSVDDNADLIREFKDRCEDHPAAVLAAAQDLQQTAGGVRKRKRLMRRLLRGGQGSNKTQWDLLFLDADFFKEHCKNRMETWTLLASHGCLAALERASAAYDLSFQAIPMVEAAADRGQMGVVEWVFRNWRCRFKKIERDDYLHRTRCAMAFDHLVRDDVDGLNALGTSVWDTLKVPYSWRLADAMASAGVKRAPARAMAWLVRKLHFPVLDHVVIDVYARSAGRPFNAAQLLAMMDYYVPSQVHYAHGALAREMSGLDHLDAEALAVAVDVVRSLKNPMEFVDYMTKYYYGDEKKADLFMAGFERAVELGLLSRQKMVTTLIEYANGYYNGWRKKNVPARVTAELRKFRTDVKVLSFAIFTGMYGAVYDADEAFEWIDADTACVALAYAGRSKPGRAIYEDICAKFGKALGGGGGAFGILSDRDRANMYDYIIGQIRVDDDWVWHDWQERKMNTVYYYRND